MFPPLRGESSLTMSVAGTRPACAMEAQSNSNVDGRKKGKREEEGRRKRERVHQQRNYHTVQCKSKTLKKA